jgi:hypothetical protein
MKVLGACKRILAQQRTLGPGEGLIILDRTSQTVETLRLYFVVPGVLLALAGFVFTLQGLGIIGPTSSFMFQDSAWIYQGLAIFFVGLLLVIWGFWKGRPKTGG